MIIGIGYARRVGKTTVAEYLRDRHQFDIVCCADVIRNTANQMTGVNTYAEEFKTKNLYHGTGRDLLLAIGKLFVHHLGDAYLVIKALENYKPIHEHLIVATSKISPFRVVIPDIRTIAQGAAIQALGGYMIDIQRQGAVMEFKDGIKPANLVIKNNGTIADLLTIIEARLPEISGYSPLFFS